MIDIDEARGLLARAVLTQPLGFRYLTAENAGVGECRYYPMTLEDVSDPNDPRTKTGCLIGVALSLSGETRHLAPEFSDHAIYGVGDSIPDMMSEEAMTYFGIAQNDQDLGKTWLEAYQAVEALYTVEDAEED